MTQISLKIIQKDITYFLAINKKLNCRILNRTMNIITHIGSLGATIIITLLTTIFSYKIGLELILNLILSQAIIHTLKLIIKRERPYNVLEGVIYKSPPKCKNSLPSGHSASIMTICLVMMSNFQSLLIIMLSIAILVGFSRIYLGYHYPTDVLMGFLIALLSFVLIYTVLVEKIPIFEPLVHINACYLI